MQADWLHHSLQSARCMQRPCFTSWVAIYDVPLPPDRHICPNHPCRDTLVQCVHVGTTSQTYTTHSHSWCACHMHIESQLLSLSVVMPSPNSGPFIGKPPGNAKGPRQHAKRYMNPALSPTQLHRLHSKCCCCSMVHIHHTHSLTPSQPQTASLLWAAPLSFPVSEEEKRKQSYTQTRRTKTHALPQQDPSVGASKQLRSQTQRPKAP